MNIAIDSKQGETLFQNTGENIEESIFILDSDIIAVNNWYCDACGGNSSTGCMMSDIDDCVRR